MSNPKDTVESYLAESARALHRRTDALFVLVFVVEYVVGVSLALYATPWTYTGEVRSIHPHVVLATLLGSVLCLGPVLLCRLEPGAASTRQVVAVSQMLIGVMWIHITGGRIETHFHVFCSLALLAVYRDPWVVVSGSAVVVVDHLVRGTFIPESVYGVSTASFARTLEHGVWVVFIDIFLLRSIATSRADMRTDAVRRRSLARAAEQEVHSQAQTRAMAAVNAELTAARDRALELVRLKAQFLANVSHEIRTPMNGILGMTAILLDGPLTADQRETAQIVQRSSEHLLAVVNDVLDFSKLEVDRVEAAQVPFSPREVMDDAVSMFAARAADAGLALTLDVAPELPSSATGDPVRLRQVMANLINNAIKFTDVGGIQVRARFIEATRALEVSVADTGVGIATASQAALFEPFSQVDGSLTRRHGGAGLGLSISRRLVELMGGQLWCDSAPGRGTTMSFTAIIGEAAATGLERPNAQGGVLASASELAPAPRSTPARVLLVEDNVINQRVAVRLLERLGCRVVVAVNGADGANRVHAESFDLVLMDCQMPVMDGFTATREIRRRGGPSARIPVVALTAHAMPEDRARCLEAGMNDYLSKPLRPAELAAIVERWIPRDAMPTAGITDDHPSVERPLHHRAS